MHTPDKTSAIALGEIAAHLPELERPTVIHGPLAQIDAILQERAPAIRFDAICGRHALGGIADKGSTIRQLAAHLAPNGRIALAETLSQRAQRLHQLVKLDSLDADLRQRLIAAEEAIYADASNPQVRWNADELASLFAEAQLCDIDIRCEEQYGQRHISPQQLAHWFAPGGEKRHTYANYLGQHLDGEELHVIRRLFEKELANKTLPWASTQVLIFARAADK